MPLRSWRAVLGALVVCLLALTAAPTFAVASAEPPTMQEVHSWGAVDGVGLSWTYRPVDAPMAFWVDRRVAGDTEWTNIANPTYETTYADTSAVVGVAYDYRVSIAGTDGQPDLQNALQTSATPLAGHEAPAEASTLASVDGRGPAQVADIYATASGVSLQRHWYVSPGIDLAVPYWHLGDYAIDGGYNCWLGDTTSCDDLSGKLTVARLAQRADGVPVELAAEFVGMRTASGGVQYPVRALFLIDSVSTGLPAYVVPEPTSVRSPLVADMDLSIPVQLHNVGGSDGTLTSASADAANITPPQLSDWAVSRSCLNVTIAAGGRCATYVRLRDRQLPEVANAVWEGPDGLLTVLPLKGENPYPDPNAPLLQLSVPSLVRTSATVTTTRVDAGTQPLQLHCRLDAGPVVDCGPSWSLTGLSSGNHTVTVYASDADGRLSPWMRETFAADSTAPRTALRMPSSADPYVARSPTMQVFFSVSTGPASLRYMQARRRTATPTTAYTSFSTPTGWSKILSNGVFPTPVPGREECYVARGVDLFSQVGAWSPERCFIAPLDDARLWSHGFERGPGSAAAYLSTTSSARRAGDTLSLSNVRLRQVGVVVTTCSTCGSLDVYVGSHRLGRVSTAGTAHWKRVLWLPHQAVERRGTLVLKTTSSRRVIVDGVVVRHR